MLRNFHKYLLALFVMLGVLAPNAFSQAQKISSANSTMHPGNLQLNPGTSIVNTNTLRLTEAAPTLFGTAFFKNPLRLNLARSFTTQFQLIIGNGGGANCFSEISGDGMSFMIQTAGSNASVDPIAPSVAVEFDTFFNSIDGDPDGNHIGININGNKTSVTTAPVSPPLDNGSAVNVWIEYSGETQLFEVRVSPSMSRPTPPTLTHSIDLRNMIGQDVFVGFTGSTSLCHATHDVRSFYFDNKHIPTGLDSLNISYESYAFNVSLSPNPNSIPADGSTQSQLSVLLTSQFGAPPSSPENVILTSNFGDIVPSMIPINSSGMGFATFTSNMSGMATIRATGDGGFFGEATVAVGVPAQPSVPLALNYPFKSVRSSSPAFSGTATPGATVTLVIDDIEVGSIQADANGQWGIKSAAEFADGPHAIYVKSVNLQSQTEQTSARQIIFTGGAVLDFNGDGLSDQVVYSTFGSSVAYKIQYSSESLIQTRTLIGKVPAPADYDGDGITDIATIRKSGKNFIWASNFSSDPVGSGVITGKSSLVREITFGSVRDTLITGCYFIFKQSSSPAFLSGSSIKAIDFYDGKTEKTIGPLKGAGTIIGCADFNGDGLDEVITTREDQDGTSDDVLVFDQSGNVLSKINTAPYSRAFIIRRPGKNEGSVILVRLKSAKKRSGEGLDLLSDFRSAEYDLPRKLIVSSGLILDPSDNLTQTVIWQELKDGRIYRRHFRSPDSLFTNGKVAKSFSLMMPQIIYNTR